MIQQTKGEDRPTVSIIMNCMNGERYLQSAINSIYQQNFDDWELIFWDNLSTDSSAEIAKQFDHRLKYFLGDRRQCLGDARSQALKRARGKYITFLDTDDLYLVIGFRRKLHQWKRQARCFLMVE